MENLSKEKITEANSEKSIEEVKREIKCPQCGEYFYGNKCPKCGWETVQERETVGGLNKSFFTKVLSVQEISELTKQGSVEDWITALLDNPYLKNIITFLAAFTFSPAVKKVIDSITDLLKELDKKKKKKSSLVLESVQSPESVAEIIATIKYGKKKDRVDSPIKSDILLKDLYEEEDKSKTKKEVEDELR